METFPNFLWVQGLGNKASICVPTWRKKRILNAKTKRNKWKCVFKSIIGGKKHVCFFTENVGKTKHNYPFEHIIHVIMFRRCISMFAGEMHVFNHTIFFSCWMLLDMIDLFPWISLNKTSKNFTKFILQQIWQEHVRLAKFSNISPKTYQRSTFLFPKKV